AVYFTTCQRNVAHCLEHVFFFSSRRRHTRFDCDWSSDVCSSDLVVVRVLIDGAAEENTYDHGGFKLYDVSDRTRPKLITHKKTWGRGVHRFDMDSRYAYISTEMQGYVGNILVIYDIRDPAKPQEVSRWWMPG